ncbi:uncharacterized protein LOC144664966 [Oculina patagonica]
MGRVFSSLSGRIERWTTIFRLQITYPIENTSGEEDDDSGKDDYPDDIQIQDCPDGSDFHLDENREDDVMRSEPKPSNAVKCTYDVQVYNGGNVVIGDNSTIIVPLSDQRVKKIQIANGVAVVVSEEVEEEAQISSRTNAQNITLYDSFITAIGDGNVIYVLQECPYEASIFDQSVRRRLFPLRSEPLMLPSPGVDPEIKKVFNRMREIVDELYPLRDSGKWQEFETALNRLHSKYDIHPAIKSFLLLEESVKLSYQQCLTAAKRKATESLNIVNNDKENLISGALQDVLRALGNVALASIFRRLPRKKLGKAFKYLEDAKECSERLKSVNLTMPKFALAFFDYEQARWFMEFATVKSEPKSCNKEACKFLGQCIDRCRALADETQMYTAKQTFALVYLARLSLPNTAGCSQPGQCKKVKKQCARQAEKHLEEYQRSHNHLGEYPVAARVKYLMTRSELCFLKKSYALAKDFACQALDIAVKRGFELETAPAQNHLDQIFRHCSSTVRQDKLPRLKNLSSSYSSSTTSDSDQKYNFTGTQRAT